MYHLEQIRVLAFLEVTTDSLFFQKLPRKLAAQLSLLRHEKGDKAKLQGQEDYSMTDRHDLQNQFRKQCMCEK